MRGPVAFVTRPLCDCFRLRVRPVSLWRGSSSQPSTSVLPTLNRTFIWDIKAKQECQSRAAVLPVTPEADWAVGGLPGWSHSPYQWPLPTPARWSRSEPSAATALCPGRRCKREEPGFGPAVVPQEKRLWLQHRNRFLQ